MIRRTICCLCLSLVLGLLYGRAGQLWCVLVFLLLLCLLAAGIFRFGKERGKVFLLRAACCMCLFYAGTMDMQAHLAVRNTLERNLSQG